MEIAKAGEDDKAFFRAVVPDDDRVEVEGAGDFGPAGRPMKEYVAVPAAWREDRAVLATWVDRSLEHAAALPPK